MRVLIAVTHLLGAGHLTRAAALARALAAAGHETVLVSGGTPAPLVGCGGARLVQLPPVRIAGTAFSRLLGADGGSADDGLLDRRSEILLGTLDEAAPDAVVTELFPFGRRALAREFLTLVEAARARRPRPVILASVRDILVAPEKPDRIAQTHARLADLYDAVLVHGDPALVQLDASWPLDPATARMIYYTGYVDEGGPAPPAACRAGILVAAGSSAAGLALFRAAAEAARARPDLGWRILVGHGVSEGDFSAIGRGLADGVVLRARPDYRALLAGAALSVSQCGYNTGVDLLATGTPAILVPFEAGRETEQRLRADRLASRGLARILPEAQVSADALLDAVATAAAVPPPGPHGIDLGGAVRSVAIIAGLVEGRRPIHRPRREAAAPSRSDDAVSPAGPGPVARRRKPLERLRAVLDAAAERDQAVGLWWRDDDAVAATPALDRLLALADRHTMPLVLAAIPAEAEPSLGRRLAAQDRVGVAVHGLAHADHAPQGGKSAEFGAHRPLAVLRREAARALALARERLPGERLLPVFVPPWNRLSPELAAALPGLGYRGLSAAVGPPVAGLVRVDATLDPIDWRGSRSLRDPDGLVDALAEALARDPARPVGLLTHHLVQDDAVWTFVDTLLRVLLAHPAVNMRDPRHLFAASAVDSGAAQSRFEAPARVRIG